MVAELKFCIDSGDDATAKVILEIRGPNRRGRVVVLVVGAKALVLQIERKSRQSMVNWEKCSGTVIVKGNEPVQHSKRSFSILLPRQTKKTRAGIILL